MTTGVKRSAVLSAHVGEGEVLKKPTPAPSAKQVAGYRAVDEHVRSGMLVGLGTGSTAYFAVERVGQKVASGELKDIVCVATSERTREQASCSLFVITTAHGLCAS